MRFWSACALLAGGVSLAALEHSLGGARYLHGPHPKQDVIWIRTPEAPDRLLASITYERNYGKPNRGKLSGSCTLFELDGSVRRVTKINAMKVRRFQAGRNTSMTIPAAEGQLLSCEIRMKGMPRIPEGGWAEVKIGLADRLDEAASPWVEILAVSPESPSRLRAGDEVVVTVLYENPTSRTLGTWAGLIAESTGLSPGVATDEPFPLLEPGERREIAHTMQLVENPANCKWDIDRVRAGLFDPGEGRLFQPYDGLELKATKLHSFRLNICD